MRDIQQGEPVYIDSSIWIIHHSMDLPLKRECTEFLRSVELGNWRASISTLVVDEVAYILLKQKASELLDEDRHHKILNGLKKDEDLFSKCWGIAQKHVDYALALEQKGVLRIITQMPVLNILINNREIHSST